MPTKPTTTIKRKTVRPILEWKLQASAVKRMFELQRLGLDFLYAASMNGVFIKGSQAKVKAQATGMMAGEGDMTVYMPAAQIGILEYKGKNGRLTESQEERFPLLTRLGFRIAIIKTASEAEAADATEWQVREWLANPQQFTAGGQPIVVAHNDNVASSEMVAA